MPSQKHKTPVPTPRPTKLLLKTGHYQYLERLQHETGLLRHAAILPRHLLHLENLCLDLLA